MKRAYEIICEDEYILVVNKSAPLLTLPDRYASDIENLQDMLKSKYSSLFTLHRLDKGTSGVLLFAKDAETHKDLNQQFERNEVIKLYDALAYGSSKKDTFDVDAPLLEDKTHLIKVDKAGKPSRTSFEVISRMGNYIHFKAQLHTGRTHQIRVHLQYVGLPLLADEQYGYRYSFFVSQIKKKYKVSKGKKERAMMSSRSSLHASSISFKHPKSKDVVKFEAPLPKSMKATLYQLNKWSNLA